MSGVYITNDVFSVLVDSPLIPSLLFFLYFVLCSPGWCQTHYVVKAGLELLMDLPVLPEYWDYNM